MSDIKCAVCGEPWEVYDSASDMKKWEYKLFRQGAGCPSCEGVKPAGRDVTDSELDTLKQVVMDGGDDPDGFSLMQRLGHIEATGEAAPKAEWKAPASIVHQMCHGCGVRIITDPDDEKKCYDVSVVKHQYFSAAHYMVRGYEFLRDDEKERGTDEFVPVVEGRDDSAEVYCPACIEMCHNGSCRTLIFTRTELEPGDTYAPGQSFPNPEDEYHKGAVCIDCFETLTSELEAANEEEARRQNEDDEDDNDEEEVDGP